jgi:hypothetical protein
MSHRRIAHRSLSSCHRSHHRTSGARRRSLALPLAARSRHPAQLPHRQDLQRHQRAPARPAALALPLLADVSSGPGKRWTCPQGRTWRTRHQGRRIEVRPTPEDEGSDDPAQPSANASSSGNTRSSTPRRSKASSSLSPMHRAFRQLSPNERIEAAEQVVAEMQLSSRAFRKAASTVACYRMANRHGSNACHRQRSRVPRPTTSRSSTS